MVHQRQSDLYEYRKAFGLGDCTTENGCFRKLNQAGQPSPLQPDNSSWSQEAALDLDMASAICPGCKLLLIQADSNSLDDLSKAVATAAQLDAHAMSNSYGAAESRWVAPYEQRYNIPGVAVTASTGDSGYGVSFPASSPHVVAVGGTNLSGSNGSWSETVWSGTGSGCSAVFAKPSWQTDTACGKRTVGDVAAVADPNTGVSVFWTAPGTTGGSCDPSAAGDCPWYVFGGTSVGAPIIAAAYAINGGPVNYAANVYSQATALNDITAGSNGRCIKRSPTSAQPGQDLTGRPGTALPCPKGLPPSAAVPPHSGPPPANSTNPASDQVASGGPVCSASHPTGTSVTLTATPANTNREMCSPAGPAEVAPTPYPPAPSH